MLYALVIHLKHTSSLSGESKSQSRWSFPETEVAYEVFTVVLALLGSSRDSAHDSLAEVAFRANSA